MTAPRTSYAAPTLPERAPVRLWLTAMASVLMLLLTVAPAQADTDDDDDDDSGVTELVVGLVATSGVSIDDINGDYGTVTLDELSGARGVYLLDSAGSEVETLVDRMEADPRLRYAEPNRFVEAPEASTFFKWADKRIEWLGLDAALWREQPVVAVLGLPNAHRVATGAGVTVAVLDTGVQPDHPALAGRLTSAGYDLVDDDSTPTDVGDGLDNDADGIVDEGVGHGTQVAGLVALVAPDARLVPLRVLDSDGRGSFYGVAEGLIMAAEAGADVVNLSLGSTADSETIEELVEDLEERGVTIVAAAGNRGTASPQYPAAEEDVVAVASVSLDDEPSVFSGRGSWVDMSAPGEDIVSAFPVSGYARASGTSMASALVAGQAAVLHAAGVSPETLPDTIAGSAVPVGDAFGAGRIDVAASVSGAVSGAVSRSADVDHDDEHDREEHGDDRGEDDDPEG